MQLLVQTRPVGDVIVVQCNGRIVAGPEVQSLQYQMERAMREHRDIVLQLEQVQFVDSSGIGALVRLVSSAKTSDHNVSLCALPQVLRKTLEVTNLLPLFKTYESEAEAITAAYMGSRYGAGEAGDTQPRILCVFDSAEVRAFLGEVLCRAGFRALTSGNVPDAKILLKATKAKLVVLGGNMQSVHGASTQHAFEEIDPSVSLIVLDADFAARDPGEAAMKLLERIRSAVQAKAS
jgi:anti-sigma B factor antagonist